MNLINQQIIVYLNNPQQSSPKRMFYGTRQKINLG